MRYRKTEKWGRYEATARKADFYRKKVLTALPYSLAQMPEYQPDWEAEVARRQARSDAMCASGRAFKARQWREARATFYALPEVDRAAVRHAFTTRQWGPADSGSLVYLIKQHQKGQL